MTARTSLCCVRSSATRGCSSSYWLLAGLRKNVIVVILRIASQAVEVGQERCFSTGFRKHSVAIILKSFLAPFSLSKGAVFLLDFIK